MKAGVSNAENALVPREPYHRSQEGALHGYPGTTNRKGLVIGHGGRVRGTRPVSCLAFAVEKVATD